MRITDLGMVPYSAALAAQERAAAEVAADGPGTLFLLEHPPVITFGKNGGEENLPFPPEFFRARGVELAHASRGGNITCHFPGQLVAYPVLRVDKRPGGLRRFFADMEESVIRTLARFGINGARMEGRPGVWVGGGKICSTGIAVKRWISRHGLSLNVARDLSLFAMVTPCGLPGVQASSMSRMLDRDVSIMEVKAVFAEEFCAVFGVTQQYSDAGVASPVGE